MMFEHQWGEPHKRTLIVWQCVYMLLNSPVYTLAFCPVWPHCLHPQTLFPIFPIDLHSVWPHIHPETLFPIFPALILSSLAKTIIPFDLHSSWPHVHPLLFFPFNLHSSFPVWPRVHPETISPFHSHYSCPHAHLETLVPTNLSLYHLVLSTWPLAVLQFRLKIFCSA